MLIPDHETEVDYLNCEAISRTVVEIIKAHRERPLTIGIHGDWGAGKSSVLKMIECQLGKDKNIAVLWFNGWTFEGFEDAKTVLIESTITELSRQRSAIGKVKEKASELLKRVNWLKIAKHGSGIALNFLKGFPSPEQIGDAIAAIKGIAQNVANIDTVEIPAKLESIEGFLKSAENSDNLPETIHAFHKEFRELLDEAKVDQLVVLIDDLDRCLPETAIQTLEAIRLFLFVPKTAFVIGADDTMIEYAVRQHFPDLPVSSGPLPYARNYLEKLIQVPFRIPLLGAQETRVYVTLLLVQALVGEKHKGFAELLEKARDKLKRPWLGTNISQADVQAVDTTRRIDLDGAYVLAQQIVPILAEGTKGNPRQIKRFLNALVLRQLIAKERGFADLVSQSVLAKLMLAERFQPDFYEFIAAQAMVSEDGKVPNLNALEASDGLKAGEKKDEMAKTTAKKEKSEQTDIEKWLERDWLRRWLIIQPTIADVDLRPYIFVARDKRLLAGAATAGGLDSLIAKLSGSQLGIRAVEPDVKALSLGDAETVFSALRERVLAATTVTSSPPGIDGLTIVAKHHSSLQSEVVKLLGSFDPKELGLWALKGWNESITEPQARLDLQAVIQGWANQDENKTLKQAVPSALSALKGAG